MANSYPPWSIYNAPMAFNLAEPDTSLGVIPLEIGEMLSRALLKIFLRAAEEQTNKECGNLQMCAGLEARIETMNNTVGEIGK